MGREGRKIGARKEGKGRGDEVKCNEAKVKYGEFVLMAATNGARKGAVIVEE